MQVHARQRQRRLQAERGPHQQQAGRQGAPAQARVQGRKTLRLDDGPALHEPLAQQEHAEHHRREYHQVAQAREEVPLPLQHGFGKTAVGIGLALAFDQRRHVRALRIHRLVPGRCRFRVELHQAVQRAQAQDQHRGAEVGQQAQRQQPASVDRPECQQQQRHQGVGHEDVAGPYQHGMRQANAEQGQRTPPVQAREGAPRGFGALRHQREAHAEQQREQRVELALHQEIDQRVGPGIGPAKIRVQAAACAEHRAGEGLQVHQQDAQQGEAADDVQHMQSLRLGHGGESDVRGRVHCRSPLRRSVRAHTAPGRWPVRARTSCPPAAGRWPRSC